MFSLMGNCVTWFKGNNKRKDVTILAVGLDNAGKSTTVLGVKGEPNNDIAPTMGFSSIDLRSGKYNVKIFDLGGGARIRGIWNSYMAEAHGVIYVVDSSDLERMEECRETFDNLVSDSRLRGKPVLILGNKQDKPEAVDELDLCNRLNIDEVVNRNECFSKVILCSALPFRGNKKPRKRPKLDRGIKSGFVWLLDMIGRDYETLSDRVSKDTEEQKKREAEERRLRNERVARIRAERERLENSNENETPSTSDRPRPEGISSEELPNDSSKVSQPTDQDNSQNATEPQVSGLGGALMDDDSDEDEVISIQQHHETVTPNLPGAVVTSGNMVLSEQNEQNQSLIENDIITNNPDPRSLSAASLRDIVRDTPTPVSVIDTPKEGINLTTPDSKKALKATILIEGANDVGNIDSDPQKIERKKKKKKRRKKNKIDPGADEMGSDISFQSGAIPGKLTPLKNAPGLNMNNKSVLDKLPDIGLKPNFDSEVEV